MTHEQAYDYLNNTLDTEQWEAFISIESEFAKQKKILDTLKRHAILLGGSNTERVEIAPIYKYDEASDYEIIKEWLKGR